MCFKIIEVSWVLVWYAFAFLCIFMYVLCMQVCVQLHASVHMQLSEENFKCLVLLFGLTPMTPKLGKHTASSNDPSVSINGTV